jgi:hypothetical protein
MKQPIHRIEELEKYVPMLEAMYIDWDAHRKAHDLHLVGSDPDLKPVPLPLVEATTADGAD